MDADETRLKLRQRAAQLVERVEKIQSDLGSEKPQDWAERAIAVENDEVLERLGETEREEIAAIRAALARLDAGTYGICSKCGEAIAPGRLEALPYTIVCVDCAR